MPDLAARLARHHLTLPFDLSDDGDEIGVVVDADGRAAFTVDVEHLLPDAETLALAAILLGAINTRGMAPDAADGAALAAISALLAPIAESNEIVMAAFQTAEDALAGRRPFEGGAR